MTFETGLSLLSQATGLIAAFILYWAGFGVTWDDQTIRGTSAREATIRRRQKLLGWTGLACTVVAVGCQTFLTLRT